MLSNAAALALVLASCIARGAAQVERGFSWSFADDADHRSLQACQEIPLKLLPLPNGSFFGVPPYYMIAFEGDGIPTTVEIGSNSSNLLWKVEHKHGAVLMLTVVDSSGQDGGIPNTHYTVESTGPITSCLPPATDDLAVITPNVTDLLTTCEPWGLTITGGKKPYNLVLSAFDAPSTTNVTLGPTDDIFTFVNRAGPDAQLMVSVVDANGHWGKSTPFILTQGSQNVDCQGLITSSSTSTNSDARVRHLKTPLIAGLVGGLAVVSIISIHGWIWLRKRAHNSDDIDASAGTWDTHEAHGMYQTDWSPASLIRGGIQQLSAFRQVHIIHHHDDDIVQEPPPPYDESMARAPLPELRRERRPQKGRRVVMRLEAAGGAEPVITPASAGLSKERPVR